jgi:rod shape-determining protein MreC
VRRWWQKHGLPILLTGLVIFLAWFLRQSDGAFISEVYALISRPFQVEITIEQRLTNAKIQELETKVVELEKQQQLLKQLAGYVEQQKKPVVTAPIIGRSADYWWNQVFIGRGGEDGVKKGDVVTGVGGLVGRIIDVTPHSSRVLLISDPNSRVGTSVSRSRHLGYIQGQGSQIVVMRFFEKVPDVKVGDTITTSAVSPLYPPGLPIGKVQSLALESGPAPEVMVELTAPLNYLEWVVVHPFEPKEVIN